MKKLVLVLVLLLFICYMPSDLFAKCKGKFVNPVTDVCWQCIFPLSIGGVKLFDSDIKPPLNMETESPVCVCQDGASVTLGLRAGFFEPARIAETVKDPYCFTILGTSLDSDSIIGGSNSEKESSPKVEETFAQAHWFIFPAFALLDLFLDFPCFEDKSFDPAYITEIDSLWNNDMTSLLINPEALLFANPIAQLSCVADSIASTINYPMDALFWCMGSWGSTYPLSGHIGTSNIIQGNAALAARMIYRLGRPPLGIHYDTGTDVCGAVFLPIWKKSHWRMHIMKPVRDKTCHPIGKASLLWASGKNPPFEASGNASDNFAWMFFQKRLCCVGYSFP